MASEDIGLVQPQQGLDNHLLFHDGYNHHAPPSAQRRASVSAAEPKATTRELTGGFIDNNQQQQQQRYFQQAPTTELRGAMFFSAVDSNHQDIDSPTLKPRSSGDVSEEEEEIDHDDEDEDTDDEIDNRIKMGYQKSKQFSSLALKESRNASEDNGVRNAVTVASADRELYYSQYVQAMAETGPSTMQKDVVASENGCGFNGRKEGLYLSESRDSLRTILSDPLTGALMDDAMILPCGHSFGSGGIQHILRTKLCHTCFKALSEDSISPNLSLRTAVQAFRREEELQVLRASKKRKENCEQDRGTYGDSGQPEYSRGKGIQFPFAVTDRVIIMGNKRTPPRFVGREAIVTTQCLNGWYVVKTLDNAESVKLQYRSLAKVSENNTSQKLTSSTPNWPQSQHLT